MVFASMNKDIECSNVVKLSELSIVYVDVENLVLAESDG